ncbi:hypothetical protein EDD11_002296 [Mortierella claussenii]|nr:hypothetical protein EDD11_002296 [Mortierella claussenii]
MGAGCCKEEAIDFNGEIELSHFHLLRSVGKGAFGKVRVVQHKRTKEIYALKYINKAKCIRMRAVENIIQERRLLEEVEFPLICNLRYAFQDDENLFMVLDLMLGGDLRFHLERAGSMREDVVKFYVAEVALALDALHARRIIHRDLKPDNVLLDEHGHAHLTDFNIAVYFNPAKPLLSIAGSMAYMAPEVLLRKGYLQSVDWWSLGVVMFELLFGKRPFRGKSNDLLTNSILRDPLPFPENVKDLVSAPCLDVLSRLCERDITKRLGCTADGLDEIKKHPWFKGIDWDKLITKEATPPFEPDSKRANFDATHELEELLMEDNPLKAKKRAQMTPETELSTEMQLMEDKFIVYDYTKVRRCQSFSRPASSGRSLLRSGSVAYGGVTNGSTHLDRSNSSKNMSSTTTLDDVLATRNSSGRLESMPTKASAPAKAFRPESPSDLVGQERFNPDEEDLDQISLISISEASHVNSKGQIIAHDVPPAMDDEMTALQEKLQDKPVASVTTLVIATTPSPILQHALKHQGSSDRLTSVQSTSTDSDSPPSPSNSSRHSTLAASNTTYNNSPGVQKMKGTSGTALFSTLDSGTSISSMMHDESRTQDADMATAGGVASLMDSATTTTPPTLRSRALRDRQPSQRGGASGVARAFALSSQAQQDKQFAHGYHHQRQPSGLTRPMSAYTASYAGSLHEGITEYQESKGMTHGFHQHPFRASIAGIDALSSGLGLARGSFDGVMAGAGFGTLEEAKAELEED